MASGFSSVSDSKSGDVPSSTRPSLPERRDTVIKKPVFRFLALVYLIGISSSAMGQDESVDGLRTMLSELLVEEPLVPGEGACDDYSPDDYHYDQGLEEDLIRSLGGIWSPYRDECYERGPNQRAVTHIEHIVARREAHISGMCLRSIAERTHLASDHLNLTLASARDNRYKSDKDASKWPLEKDGYKNTCWFAAQVVKVKHAYGLSVDPGERGALERLLEDCRSVGMTSRTEFTCPP